MTPAKASLLLACLVLAGCATTQHPTGSALPEPALRLVSATPMRVPDGCAANGSVVIDFTVRADGATSDIQPLAAPDCLRDALTDWVASFRYAPGAAQVTTSIEWLTVSARRLP